MRPQRKKLEMFLFGSCDSGPVTKHVSRLVEARGVNVYSTLVAKIVANPARPAVPPVPAGAH